MAKKTVIKKEAKRAPAKKTERQSYVQYETIKKGMGTGLNYPGEMKVCTIGKHKVVVQRHERLDRYGKPIYTAATLKGDGSLGPKHTGKGSVSTTVSRALGKSGVKTKWGKSKRSGK